MGARYVGGEPTRITSYSQRKNIDRWMSKPKAKMQLPGFDDVLCGIAFVVSSAVVVAFILVCFR